MEQSKDTVINNLVNELDELKTKIFKLETFMTCRDFLQITAEQKRLLEQQYDAMHKYKTILMQRVYNLRFELAREKAQTCEAPKEEEPIMKTCSQCKYSQRRDYEDPCISCNPTKDKWEAK